MKQRLALSIGAVILAACYWNDTQLDHGSLSVGESAAAVHLPCLDTDGNDMVTSADFTPLEGGQPASEVPDFNADGVHDERDRVFLDVDLAIDPAVEAACEGNPPVDYLVGGGGAPALDCTREEAAVVIVGVAGGSANLREAEDGAGVRFIVNGLLDAVEARGMQALGVVAGPGVGGVGEELHAGMEQWMTHSVRTYLEQYPCAAVVLLGHSHGAVTTDVVASRLEGQYAGRIALVVALDRIDDLYFGDTASMPQAAPVFSIFETNDETLHGVTRDGDNVENWDASGESAPEDGEEGGAGRPVLHSTIDNSEAVRDRIIDEVTSRLEPRQD